MRIRIIALLLIIVIGIGVFFVMGELQNNGILTFDPGERYQSQNLNYMGVIYANRSSQYGFFEGYSETNSCPWGFIHSGIDYFFINDSEVIAAAPGYVEDVSWRENSDSTLNMYNIYVAIRFNASIVLYYTFEPFTHVEGDHERQLAMLAVQEGDWISKGAPIARFLYVEDGAHVDFGVMKANDRINPEPFFGTSDHDEIMALINEYHLGWNLSYPAP